MKTQFHSPVAMVRIASAATRFFRPQAFRWAALLILAAVAFGPRPAQAAVTEAWVHRYSNVVSNSVDVAVKVVSDAAGDIIVAGSTDQGLTGQDMLTIKYSGADGSVIWQRRYNGPANDDDLATALVVDAASNAVIGGISQGDYYTAKYAAADGAILWEKRTARPGTDRLEVIAPLSVAVDRAGNVAAAGAVNGDYYTVKYAGSDGAIIWERRYDGVARGNDRANAVTVDSSGDVIVTGAASFNESSFFQYYAAYTAKYAAADGALLWERYSRAAATWTSTLASAVGADSRGNALVSGYSIASNGQREFYIAKYAALDGAILWEKNHDLQTEGDDYPTMALDNSGNVVLTGISASTYYVAKYASVDGTLLWEKRFGTPAARDANGVPLYASAVSVDGSGNVAFTGATTSQRNFGVEYYTAKLEAANGALLWEKTYIGPAAADYPLAIAVDRNGHVVVTGYSTGAESGQDFYTIKYAAVAGELLWDKRYNGSRNQDDRTRAVAIDARGNVVVTGTSENGEGRQDYYTQKYAAADGALLWAQRGPSGDAFALALDNSGSAIVAGSGYAAKYAAEDGAILWTKKDSVVRFALALDRDGNAVITGSSNNGKNNDFYTAKYAAADGSLLWEQRYSGPVHYGGWGNGMAVDPSGNVVVTGAASNPDDTIDFYTAKYAAADGRLLWERRYDGPAHHNDYPRAIVVDGLGNVVVTGGSENGRPQSDGRSDYYTAKYAALDGTLLWEKRYNGLGNHDDYAFAVAVDSSGNAVVTGASENSVRTLDYYTAKYAAADGALLWEKRYHGGENSFSWARAVAVDAIGDAIVTGFSTRTNGYNELYTAKYAALNGALLWEKHFMAPTDGGNEVWLSRSLAIGPNGTVAVTASSYGDLSNLGSARDYVTVLYREALSALTLEVTSSGIRLSFAGAAGQSYSIQRAPSIIGPWSTINTQTAAASGLLDYRDANPPVGAAFYRTSEP